MRRMGLLLLLLAIPACSRPPAAAEAVQTYPVRGIVRGVVPVENAVVIEHEDVPGFMPSMTMPFQLKDRSDGEKLSAGDAIRFDLFVSKSHASISNIQKIDPKSVTLPEARKAAAPGVITRLKEGDPMPEIRLIDQAGREITRASFGSKALLFTFIFTRCPIPNYCPLMSKNFAELQETLKADPAFAERVQLLSISFDPEHDTPEVLSKFAAVQNADGDRWRFATGDPEEIAKLTKAFSVSVNPEAGAISHGLATVLVAPDGTIRKIWRGNGWKTEEVLEALRSW